jgi:D-alanyl-D-alanine carboxypeptidase
MLESHGLLERWHSGLLVVLLFLLVSGAVQSYGFSPALADSGSMGWQSGGSAGGILRQPGYINYSSEELGVSCKAYMVYDLDAAAPVALYNLERQQPIASLSKLMTAILAEENLRFDGHYLLTAEEQKTFGVEYMRADKMLEMAMIPSNNAVCKLIARLVSGSEAEFARLMNSRAAALGLKDTRFVNASGLPQDGQYSTLYDVALLGRYAMSYPRTSAAMCKSHVDLNGVSYKGTLHDLYVRHNSSSTGRLLGGKTGYTKAAGRCLCLLYEQGGRRYLVVTLSSSGSKASFRDVEVLLSTCGIYRGAVGEWK